MKLSLLILLILFAAFYLLLTAPARAQIIIDHDGEVNFGDQNQNNITSLIEGEWKPIQLLFGGGQPSDPRVIIAVILKLIFSVIGIIFIILVIYGGFLWMTAGGNTEQIDKAKSTLLHGVAGVGVVFLAFAIARFVVVVLGCSVREEAPEICIFMMNVIL